jgi:two-component system cell cycle response regulator DivK
MDAFNIHICNNIGLEVAHMRIIYVEDNVANIALLERICQMSKDDLITYLDADTALTEIGVGTSDLIIIDLHLGTKATDGLQLSRALRDNGVTEPIIAITSYDHLFRDHYLEAGCDEYIRKPVSVETFLATIDHYRT